MALSGLDRLELSAVVFRACRHCGCANPPRPEDLPNHDPFDLVFAHPWTDDCPRCGSSGQPGEHHGIVAAWYRNPLKRTAFAIKDWWRRCAAPKQGARA